MALFDVNDDDAMDKMREMFGPTQIDQQIRQAIQAGKITEANTLLGSPYSLMGQVIHGKGRGKGIGYPTANIQVEHPRKLIPQQGVYAVWVETEYGKQAGMMNIGTNPTFESGPQIHLEVHLLDWQGDLYDKTIRIIFVEPKHNYW